MKKVLSVLIIAIFSLGVFGQAPKSSFNLLDYGVQIEPDKRLIAVLASLEAVEIETPLSEQGEEFRKSLREDLRRINPALRQKLRLFIENYKKTHPKTKPSELVAPFISMAYSLGKTPDLKEPDRSLDLPDDLLEVLDYSKLVREFYQTPGIAEKIDAYYKTYKAKGNELQPSAVEMVRDILNYLNTRPQLFYNERVKAKTQDSTDSSKKKKKKEKPVFTTIEHQRRFKIVPEMLAPKDTVNFLNIGDDYFAIISPQTTLSSSEVRRAYLQFVLDPIVLKNASEIIAHQKEIKSLLNERRKAGVLVSPDAFLAVSRSLVAAADVREEQYRKETVATVQARQKISLIKETSEKKIVADELQQYKNTLADEAALQLLESYEKGAVLSFYFAEKFKDIEGSGFDIATFLKDWVTSLKPADEGKRLEQFAEARERAAAKRASGGVKRTGNPVTEKLLEVEKLIDAKKYVEAEKELTALLNKHPSEVRIFYALGQVVNLSAGELKDPEQTKKRLQIAIVHYSNAVRIALPITSKTKASDLPWVSLAYYDLGRIYEYYDNNEYAIKIYEAALSIGNVKGGAYQKASLARRKLLGKMQK